MILSDALSLVCGEACLQISSAVAQATQPVRMAPGKVKDQSLTTWLVRDTHMFTLIKAGDVTLVYSHGNSMLFFAKPEFMLHRNVPDGHAFLSQLAEDKEAAGIVPRLLVMDLVTPCIDDPRARHQIVRNMSPLFPPTCVLQWAGQVDALRSFLKSGLPHEVAGIVTLGKPLQLTKELRVEAPVNVLQRIIEGREEQGTLKRPRA